MQGLRKLLRSSLSALLHHLLLPHAIFQIANLVRLRNGNAFDLLDFLAFKEAHQSSDTRHDTTQGNKGTGAPTGTVEPVETPHDTRKNGLKDGVPDVHPDDKVEFPYLGGRCSDTCERYFGCL